MNTAQNFIINSTRVVHIILPSIHILNKKGVTLPAAKG